MYKCMYIMNPLQRTILACYNNLVWFTKNKVIDFYLNRLPFCTCRRLFKVCISRWHPHCPRILLMMLLSSVSSMKSLSAKIDARACFSSGNVLMSKVQHKVCFLIQLNAYTLYPFACSFLWLLCLRILMLIILMLILIWK